MYSYCTVWYSWVLPPLDKVVFMVVVVAAATILLPWHDVKSKSELPFYKWKYITSFVVTAILLLHL